MNQNLLSVVMHPDCLFTYDAFLFIFGLSLPMPLNK